MVSVPVGRMVRHLADRLGDCCACAACGPQPIAMLHARIAGRTRRRTALLVPVGCKGVFHRDLLGFGGRRCRIIARGVLDRKRIFL